MAHRIAKPVYKILHWRWPESGPLAHPEYEVNLPDPSQKLSFYMEDTEKELMNALRTTIDTNHLQRPALHLNTDDIIIPTIPPLVDRYIILEELKHRVQGIPIHPETPPDCEWKIDVVNNTSQPRIIYSRDLVMTKGTGAKLFDDGFRICKIAPGTCLKVNKITVKVRGGDKNARYCGTSRWKWREVDFTDVDMINELGRIVKTICKTEDLQALAKAKKPIASKGKPVPEDLYKTSWLIVPNPDWIKLAPESFRANFEDYDWVFHTEIATYQSYNMKPKHYYMELVTDNYHPALLMRDACLWLARRMQQVVALLDKKAQTVRGLASDVQIQPEGDHVVVVIKDENEIIGNLLTRYVLNTDPAIRYVAPRREHLLKDTSMVVINHPEPEKMIRLGCQHYVEIFNRLGREFAELVSLPDSDKHKKSVQKSDTGVKTVKKPAAKKLVPKK